MKKEVINDERLPTSLCSVLTEETNNRLLSLTYFPPAYKDKGHRKLIVETFFSICDHLNAMITISVSVKHTFKREYSSWMRSIRESGRNQGTFPSGSLLSLDKNLIEAFDFARVFFQLLSLRFLSVSDIVFIYDFFFDAVLLSLLSFCLCSQRRCNHSFRQSKSERQQETAYWDTKGIKTKKHEEEIK